MALINILTLKVFLFSSAVVFAAVGLKAALPTATTHIPLVWSFCVLCFKPPYLYVIVNAIIISIVASSKLHRSNHQTPLPHFEFTSPEQPVLEANTVLVNASHALQHEQIVHAPHALQHEQLVNASHALQNEQPLQEEKVIHPIEFEETLKRMDSPEIQPEYLTPTEKPLVSARFGHRKPLKSTHDGGRALRPVSKPKRHETLENTWKTITEGRAMPLSRHMKKCDTWQNRGSEGPHDVMNKSETFKDRTNHQLTMVSVSAPKLRKEPSLSQDELNRRVEAFIHKFNEEMRLQRQESLNQYMQMINRSAG